MRRPRNTQVMDHVRRIELASDWIETALYYLPEETWLSAIMLELVEELIIGPPHWLTKRNVAWWRMRDCENRFNALSRWHHRNVAARASSTPSNAIE